MSPAKTPFSDIWSFNHNLNVSSLGFTTKEEFVRDAIRFRLNWLKSGNECLEIPRDQYEELNEAVKEMDMPFRTVEQFVNSQIDQVLEKYEEFKKSRR